MIPRKEIVMVDNNGTEKKETGAMADSGVLDEKISKGIENKSGTDNRPDGGGTPHDGEDPGVKSSVKKKIFGVVPVIVCAILAVMLWYYVIQVDNDSYEETFSGVTVELAGTNELQDREGLFVYSGYNYTVNVTVSGKKTVISKYSASDIKVTADLSHIDASGEYDVALSTTLPSGMFFVRSDFDTVSVFVDEKAQVTLPVKVAVVGITKSGELDYGDPEPEIADVVVTGPKTEVALLDHAVVNVDLNSAGIIEKTVETVRTLDAVSKQGDTVNNPYLQFSKKEVKVKIPVFATKEVPLVCSFEYGFMNADNAEITVSPAMVTIKGEPSVISRISNITVATFNEKTIVDNVKTFTGIELPESDSYSYVDESTVNVTVKQVGTATKNFIVSNIEVASGTNSIEISDRQINVRLRGPEEMLSQLTSADIKVTASVADYASGSGKVSVPATVEVIGKRLEGVYDVYLNGTPYSVSVVIY